MKTNNAWRFFAISVTHYFAQSVFFVSVSGHLSKVANPLVSLGNFLLLAMVPFLLSGFYLAPLLDRTPSKRQLIWLKLVRSGSLLGLAVGIFSGLPVVALLYASVLVFDLAFYVFQSTAAKVSKELERDVGVKLVESISLLGMQLGMISGGLVAGFLLSVLPFGSTFVIGSVIEIIGLFWILKFSTQNLSSPQVQTSVERRSLLKVIGNLMQRPALLTVVLSFAMILPIFQVVNLTAGPWVESLFSDSGRTLGFVTSGIAFGACVGSFGLMKLKKLRESKLLVLAPLATSTAIALLLISARMEAILALAIAFGFTFSLSRVAVRAAMIEAAPLESVAELTIVGLMTGIVFSVGSIFLIRTFDTGRFAYAFSTLFFLTFLQFVLVGVGYLFSQRSKLKQHQPA